MKSSILGNRLLKFWLILILLITILLIGCNFSDSDYEDYYYENEISYKSENESNSQDFGDEEIPIILTDSIGNTPPFARDFKFILPIFSSDSPWNQTAKEAAVLPESEQLILTTFRVLLGDYSSLEGYDGPATEWPFMDISLYDFTVPVFPVGEGMQEVFICQDNGIVGWAHPKFDIETEGGPVIVPAPEGTIRPSGPENEDADGWLVLYDPESFISYDYFAATPFLDEKCFGFKGGLVGDKILQAGVVDYFDIKDMGTNPDGYYSARAAGTPLLAGLILPEDVESGEIAHALSFAIPGPRNTSSDPFEPSSSDYFYPASTTETDFYNTDSYSLASGQRIRLKETIYNEEAELINEAELAPITQMFLAALRNYGAYLVDNSGGFTFYAEDAHTAVLDLTDNEIKELIGEPSGFPLPERMTNWQIVIEQLGNDLELIPFAILLGDEDPDPEDAQIEISNFEVIEPAYIP